MHKELKNIMSQQYKNYIKAQMDFILNNNYGSFEIPMISMNDAESYLGELYGASSLDDLDSNGWDSDYWLTLALGERRISLSGSGYFGGVSVELQPLSENCDGDCSGCISWKACDDYEEGGK